MAVKRLCILGATGSIGCSTLDVVAQHPDRFRVVALTAHRQVDRLLSQCLRFHPDVAVVGDPEAARRLRDALDAAGVSTQVWHGEEGLIRAAALPEADMTMAAIVGAAGLMPTLSAVRAGKTVLLANKESLVMGGALFMDEVRRHGARLIPIDSEHNAIFQCLPRDFAPGLAGAGVRRLMLTASGGPFRNMAATDMAAVTPEAACAHPNWVMGRKISVDSATLMNKGLELIEAHWLFGLPPEQIEVVVHPQSVIHSLVEYVDGSTLAQLGHPDMRTPIAHAMGWPDRLAIDVPPLDLVQLGKLGFEAPDHTRFPCLGLAYDALRAGGGAPVVLNAANEMAVAAFLERRLPFLGIPELIDRALQRLGGNAAGCWEAVIELDLRTRASCAVWLGEGS
ncbi:MAG TPA: 1-deoxy-D-xylulose-5-phosphate reductoisomerase [Candidatus Acidoferrales bacterium]|nr:1-deoxy-D-xylulose-5-phosphate reductoisomerase [Candidatus Acidoferrales bacterium]